MGDADTCANKFVTNEDLTDAENIWNYMKLGHRCEKSDVILCLCSYDIRVAEKAAELWLQGMGKLLVFSGKSGKLTEALWTKPEAEVFKEKALEMGVPDDNIMTETESTNTGENVRFVYKLMCDNNMAPSSIIIVQKPYMERRAFATFSKQWPGNIDKLKFSVTSPDIALVNYPSQDTGCLADVITVLVGDMARIPLYEELGFQTHQEVPDEVQTSFERLKSTGKYSSHMPK